METKLWKELLFLFLPLVAFIAFSLMSGCGRVSLGDRGSHPSSGVANSRIDPYNELRLNAEEQKVLEQEKRMN